MARLRRTATVPEAVHMTTVAQSDKERIAGAIYRRGDRGLRRVQHTTVSLKMRHKITGHSRLHLSDGGHRGRNLPRDFPRGSLPVLPRPRALPPRLLRSIASLRALRSSSGVS